MSDVNEAAKQKRTGGYHKRPNDLITAKEAVLLVDHRVSVLLAHWENERRQREAARAWWRRCLAVFRAHWRYTSSFRQRT